MKVTALEAARAAWGAALPDWVEALAAACTKSSQRQTAYRIGLSPAAINLLVNNRYAPRPHDRIEKKIRKALGVAVASIVCPVLGDIPPVVCRVEQAGDLITCSPVSVQLYRACRSDCPHFKGKEE